MGRTGFVAVLLTVTKLIVASRSARSAPVITIATPGIAAASDTSIPVILACATDERRNSACSAPSGAMSST